MLPQNKNINLEIGQNFVEVCEGIDMAVIRKNMAKCVNLSLTVFLSYSKQRFQ